MSPILMNLAGDEQRGTRLSHRAAAPQLGGPPMPPLTSLADKELWGWRASGPWRPCLSFPLVVTLPAWEHLCAWIEAALAPARPTVGARAPMCAEDDHLPSNRAAARGSLLPGSTPLLSWLSSLLSPSPQPPAVLSISIHGGGGCCQSPRHQDVYMEHRPGPGLLCKPQHRRVVPICSKS